MQFENNFFHDSFADSGLNGISHGGQSTSNSIGGAFYGGMKTLEEKET